MILFAFQAKAILKHAVSLPRYTNIESWNDTVYDELGNILSGINGKQCRRMTLTNNRIRSLQSLNVVPEVVSILFLISSRFILRFYSDAKLYSTVTFC